MMPPLPEPDLEGVDHEVFGQNFASDCWFAEKVRAHAAACVAAARAEDVRVMRMALEAVAELVACKDLKDEESRLRQRRENSAFRNPEGRREIDAMRDDYNRRKPLAWAAVRRALSALTERLKD